MKIFLLLPLMILIGPGSKAQKGKVLQLSPPAIGLKAITESDLKKDMYEMADDHFRGRESGTIDEMKVSVWLADKARIAGLKPAGDDGTFFQFFSMQRNRISPHSEISINGRSFELWKDVLLTQTAPSKVALPIVYMQDLMDKTVAVKGKAVAIQASPLGLNLDVSLKERRYPGLLLNQYRFELMERGAQAIIFIADELGEESWKQVLPAATRGLFDIPGGPNAFATTKMPVLWIHAKDAALVKAAGCKTRSQHSC